MKVRLYIASMMITLLSCSTTGSFYSQKLSIPIGMYSIQDMQGKGHQTGSVWGIEKQIIQLIDPAQNSNFRISQTLPYRFWDRVRWPDWDFTGYVCEYMQSMYEITRDTSLSAGIQVLTPALYINFVSPPLQLGSHNIDDDARANRSLALKIFDEFINRVLLKEYGIVKKAAGGDTTAEQQAKICALFQDPRKRPLGGWYLDDEPLIRNHDLQVIISMSRRIRKLEYEFSKQNKCLSQNGIVLTHDRYIAFDGDDLHGYPKSGRKKDATFYNMNGKSIPLANKTYTLFPENTVDVVMVDFYHNDIDFWLKIIKEVRAEYARYNRTQPKLFPIVKGFMHRNERVTSSIQFNRLFSRLLGSDIDGLWIFAWQIDKSAYKVDADASDLWQHPQAEMQRALERAIEGTDTDPENR